MKAIVVDTHAILGTNCYSMAILADSVKSMAIDINAIFLFIVFFLSGYWLFCIPIKKPSRILITPVKLEGQFYELACLLEDVPQSALTGQCYHLATPLMTPLACIVKKTWHDFYRQNLGKPGIDYWEWRNFPESSHISPEVSALFQLKPPSPQFNSLLWQNTPQYIPQGDVWQQTQNHLLLKCWHENSSQELGKDMLGRIYQVCFNTSWEKIQQTIENHQSKEIGWWQVLGVKPSATASQVEKAYKKLIRLWHPDLNKAPHAHHISSMINVAYQQYRTKPFPVAKSANFGFLRRIFNFLSLFRPLRLRNFHKT